jgi:putative MATE family efflux protein
MEGTRDLTKGGVGRELFSLAAPIMATTFISLAYNLTDVAWLGHWSTEGVAAVGAAGMVMWLFMAIGAMTRVGAEVAVGIRLGQQDQVAAREMASQNVTLAAIISLIVAVVVMIWADNFLGLFDVSPAIVGQASSYMRIFMSASPALLIAMSCSGTFNAAGRTKMTFYINSLGLVVNMILDPLFIYGFRMGVAGAAWASWIASFAVLGAYVYQLKIRSTLFPDFRFFVKPKWDYIKTIFKIGAPVASLNIVFAILGFVITGMASREGGAVGLLAYTTGGDLEAICWNTAQGMSEALSAFVAQNYGAGRLDRVHKSYDIATFFCLSIGLLCTVLFVGFGEEIFRIFVPDRQAYLVGADYMRIDGYSMIFMMLEIVHQGMFYGTKRSMIPAGISIVGNIARIPIALFLISCGMGLMAIWWAICTSSIAKGLVATIWYRLSSTRLETN